MEEINWGVIGLGNIAEKFIEGFKNVENAKLKAIASKNRDKLDKFKKRFNLDENYCFSNYADLIESNEAFAAQACAVNKQLGLNPEIVNVNGGAIALGHPVGATGAIIMTKLVYELRKRKGKYGLATMCIGGGQGIAVIIEAL